MEASLPRLANPSGSAYAMRLEGAEDEQRRLLLAERARADSQQREIDELRSRDAAALGLRAEVRGARVTAAADSAMRGSAEQRAAAAEEEAAAARRDAQEARREVEEHALLLRQLRSSARAMATVAERAKRAEREARAADGLEAPPVVGGLPGVEEEARAEAEARAGAEPPPLRRGSTCAAVVAAAGQHGDLVKSLLAPQPLDEAAMLEATLFSPEGGGGGSAGLVERDLASLRADMRGFQRLRACSVGGAPPPPLLLAAMDAVASAGEDAFARLLQRELRTPAETALLAGLLGVRLPPRTPQPRASSLQPCNPAPPASSAVPPACNPVPPACNLCLQELSQLSAARVAGVGSLSRLQGAVRLCAEEMALEAQQGRRVSQAAAAKTAAAKAAAAAVAAAAKEEEEAEAAGAGATAKPEAAAGPHVRWSGSHPWRESAAAQAEAWRVAHASRDEAQRVRAARLAPPASDTSAVSGERAGGRRAAGGRAGPRPGRSEPGAHLGGGSGLLPPPAPPDGAHPAHDPAHLQPERAGPPPPPPGLPQLVGRHNPANPTAPALKLDHVSLKLKPRHAVPADLDMSHPSAVHLPTAPGSIGHAASKPGTPFSPAARAAHPPAARAALSPRAARDTRLPAASPAMSSEREREREAGLGEVARHGLESRGLELEIAAWGRSGFDSPLPIAGGASERWLPSGSGARMASGSGPHPSHTRTELDAWRRKGPGGVGAGPVGVGVPPLSPRTPRRQ